MGEGAASPHPRPLPRREYQGEGAIGASGAMARGDGGVISSAEMRPRAALAAAVLALALLLAQPLVGSSPAWAQEPPGTYHGQVLWISGRQLMLRDDDGWTYPLDISRVDQASYRGVRPGDWITAVGVLARSRSHVIALSHPGRQLIRPGPRYRAAPRPAMKCVRFSTSVSVRGWAAIVIVPSRSDAVFALNPRSSFRR